MDDDDWLSYGGRRFTSGVGWTFQWLWIALFIAILPLIVDFFDLFSESDPFEFPSRTKK
jgi:hypothetical protein